MPSGRLELGVGMGLTVDVHEGSCYSDGHPAAMGLW